MGAVRPQTPHRSPRQAFGGTLGKALRALQSRRLDLEQPGAVGELVLGVQLGVVAGAGLPHFPKDLQPALAEAAQGAGMGLSAVARGFVIDLRPTALFAA